MSDDRFDVSADMRLVELQRSALGVSAPATVWRQSADLPPLGDIELPVPAPKGSVLTAAVEARPRGGLIPGAVVTVAVTVRNDGADAVAGVRVSMPLPLEAALHAGSLAVDGARRDDAAAAALFEDGLELGTVAAGERRAVAVGLSIEPGLADVVIAPSVRAAEGAVTGPLALGLRRARAPRAAVAPERPFYELDDDEAIEVEGAGAASAGDRETELTRLSILQPAEVPPAPEPDPVAAMPAAAEQPVEAPAQASTAPSPAANIALGARALAEEPPLPPDVPAPPDEAPSLPIEEPALPPEEPALPPEEPALPSDEPSAQAGEPPVVSSAGRSVDETAPVDETPAEDGGAAAREPEDAAPDMREAPEPEDAAAPAALAAEAPDDGIVVRGAGGPVLTVTLDRRRIASLRSLFGARSLGTIAHYLVLNALAATDAGEGDGTAGGLAAFVTAQEQLLSRALIATRLGKVPAPETMEAPLPPFPPDVRARDDELRIAPAARGSVRLVRAFKANEIAFLSRVLANADAPPFLRVAQLFVGLAASDAALADDGARRTVATAASNYTSLAAAEINRIFLRAKLTRAAAPFKDTDAALDDAARAVLDALAAAVE